MKTYKIPAGIFFANKQIFDQTVFWRPVDRDIIEVRPCFKYIRLMIEEFLNKIKEK